MNELFTDSEIVDAIAEDLLPIARMAVREVDLNSCTDWRYISPDLLEADNAPWLAVWSPNTAYTLLTTVGDVNYQDDFEIEVEFALSAAQFVEQGNVGLPAFIKKAEAAAAPLLSQLRTYAEALPAPFDNQVNGTLTRAERGDRTGFVYSQRWSLTVVSLGAI